MELIFKTKRKRRDFTQVDNSILKSNELSLRSKGLLVLLLSYPENFTPARETIEQCMREGKSAFRYCMAELRRFGYAHLRKERKGDGRIRSVYDIFEDPRDNMEFQLTGSQKTAPGDIAPLLTLDVMPSEEYAESSNTGHWGRGPEDWVDELQRKGLKPRKRGKGWEALCPCHDDHKPSLSIAVGTKRKVVAKCHAGCHFEDIAFALFPGSDIPAKTFTYTDRNDKPLYRTMRIGKEKNFTVQSYVRGKWKKGMELNPKRVPYRLPQLIKGIKAGMEVWVVEGEKDVETLRSKGQIATCNVFGAGKWTCDLVDHFKGAKVTIVADKDEAGFIHARSVWEQIRVVTKSIRIVQAAGDDNVNDSSDHFAAGYGIQDFSELDPESLPLTKLR